MIAWKKEGRKGQNFRFLIKVENFSSLRTSKNSWQYLTFLFRILQLYLRCYTNITRFYGSKKSGKLTSSNQLFKLQMFSSRFSFLMLREPGDHLFSLYAKFSKKPGLLPLYTHMYMCSSGVKGALSALRQLLPIEIPLKMMKNAFNFTKALFVLKYLSFSLDFLVMYQNGMIKKIRLISNFVTS